MLAWRFYQILWVKHLSAFANLGEGYLIYIFAILCKVHFSFKKWGKSILKTESANCFCLRTPGRALPRRRARPRRRAAVHAIPSSGTHAEAPEWPPVAALRRRELPRDVRGKWACQVAPIHRIGAPPQCAIGCRGDARRRPCCGHSTRACVTGVTSSTHNWPSPTISRPPRSLPRAHA
jgi:hypothetical protein